MKSISFWMFSASLMLSAAACTDQQVDRTRVETRDEVNDAKRGWNETERDIDRGLNRAGSEVREGARELDNGFDRAGREIRQEGREFRNDARSTGEELREDVNEAGREIRQDGREFKEDIELRRDLDNDGR